MSGPNFPPGSVGSGFSLNFFRPELRAANPASMPAHNQSRNIPPNRSPFLTCQAAQGGAQTTAISSQTQKHPATATIPNLTVITPNGGLVTAAAAAAANLPQFQHQSVLNSLFQTLLRGQNSIGGVSLAMPSANVNVSYINSVNSGVTGCTSVSSTPTASERFVTVSKPSPTMTNDPSQFHGSSRSVPTGVSPNSISLKLPVQKSGSGASTQKILHQTGMNHVGLHPLPNSTVVSSDLTESCNPGVRATAITTNATSNTTNTANVAAQGGEQNSFHSLEMLFHPANIITIQPTLGPGKGTHPPIHKLGSMSFLRWASSGTRSFRRSRMSMWPRCHADLDALHGMSWIIAPTGLLGIYSDSPFLRPVLLLRRVQFATPGNPVSNFPDPDNMIRTLRELADAKVTKYSPFAPDYPTSATAVGFTTDYLSYVFTLDLDRLLVKILSEQLKPVNR
ncbi:E3 SUMO-protein ligase pli1 [Fasciola gigantica]|uniref:E3 SUMO-protein ligase pli1 n=1 Tax=Fasciola gigantica TaxID=46835 RepID=A0A504Z562_FASGI|nr:E3 SUMO-protein ligase pli1 [Fasciola gigantica]